MKRASKKFPISIFTYPRSQCISTIEKNRIKAILLLPPPRRGKNNARRGINNKRFQKTVKIRVKFAQTGSFRGKHWRERRAERRPRLTRQRLRRVAQYSASRVERRMSGTAPSCTTRINRASL